MSVEKIKDLKETPEITLSEGVDELSPVTSLELNRLIKMENWRISEDGKRMYRRRSWIAETPFAVLKTVMHFRRFLLRGLEKVKTEWLWACTAFNVRKMIRAIARLRTKIAATA